MTSSKSFYNRQFGLLCVSSVMFYASFNMIIPELPAYLTSMGGGQYIGLIIFLFTMTAGISRPFSGKLADTVGRIPVMIFGAGICFICGFLYPLTHTVALFLLLRVFHGFSTGFKPTGTSAYVADIVPSDRRGEAMGILGLCGSLGMASGPALGSILALQYSHQIMFFASSAFAILSVLILVGMRETLPMVRRKVFSFQLLRLQRNELFEPRVIAPCVTMLLTTFSFGIVLTIIPALSDSLEITNRGTFFTCFTIASVAVRFFAGKASDKFGRTGVLKVATSLLFLSMILLMYVDTVAWFIGAAVIFGLASGINNPTIFAWTIDLSHPQHRGRALASMYIAMEVGIGLGALLSGGMYGQDQDMFFYIFLLGGVLAVLAFAFLQWGIKPQSVARA